MPKAAAPVCCGGQNNPFRSPAKILPAALPGKRDADRCKPGIHAPGELGRNKFFCPPVFRAFLHSAPPTSFFIVKMHFGVEGLLGRKHPKMGAPTQFLIFKGRADPCHHLP
jgi:hypothetical protein